MIAFDTICSTSFIPKFSAQESGLSLLIVSYLENFPASYEAGKTRTKNQIIELYTV